MARLTKQQILAAPDIQEELVPVPEWGGEVMVRGLSGTERDAYEAMTVRVDKDGKRRWDFANLRARLVAMAIVGEDGRRMFSDGEVAELGAKSAGALDRVFQRALKLSGLTNEDIEELAKNSESDQSDEYTSA